MDDKTESLNAIRTLASKASTPEQLSTIIRQCQELDEAYPGNTDILITLGSLLFNAREYKDCSTVLQHAISIDSNSIKAHLLLVKCKIDMGEWKTAVPHAEFALRAEMKGSSLKINEANIEAVGLLGTDALYKGDATSAAQFYNAVIDFVVLKLQSNSKVATTFNPIDLPVLSERSVNPILYLPVEVKVREFESKCLLALAAVNAGFSVVIGRSWVLSAGAYSDLPPGIVLFKTLNAMDANNMALAKKNGRHIVAALDEEAFGRSTSSRALELNVDPHAVQTADAVLLQGLKHVETWSQIFAGETTKVVVTGNPKQDLFQRGITPRIAGQSDQVRILFCTMNGNTNPLGRSFVSTIEETIKAASIEGRNELIADLGNLMKDAAEFETSIVPLFTDCVKETAAAFPDAKIIVRPHPIEDKDLWRNKFSEFKNVQVETSGPLTDCLANCDALVHVAGCGSGVEAALQEVPAIRLELPLPHSDPGTGLSSELNIPARAAHEVVSHLKKSLENLRQPQDKRARPDLTTYFHNPDIGTVSESVINKLLEIFEKQVTRSDNYIPQLLNLKNNRKSRFTLSPFHLQKFPETPLEDVSKSLETLKRQFKLMVDYDLECIEEGVFLLTPP